MTILLSKITAVQNEVALSYYRVRGLYFLVVIFVGRINYCTIDNNTNLYTGPSVNTCQIFTVANRCTGVPKIVYMVTSQGVKFIYYVLSVINVIQF